MLNQGSILRKTLVSIIILFFICSYINFSIADDILKKSSFSLPDFQTLYVGGSGTNNYTSIQDAIDDANNGDTVYVFDDSSPYNERIEIDKTINLIGENRDSTKILWTGNVISTSADFINISGFSIFNYQGTSLYICSSHNNISDNNFSKTDDYKTDTHSGIEISNNNSDNYISNNNFYNLNGTGIELSTNCEKTIIINNTFFENYNNILVRSNCHNTKIIGNIVLGNDGTSSICVIESNNNIIKENYVTPPDTWTGIRLFSSNNNIVSNNTIFGINVSCGISLSNSNHNNIYDNHMFNCGLVVSNSFKNIVVNNIVNDKSLIYLENYSNLTIANNSGQILLVNCKNITIKNQKLSNTYWGLALLKTTNCYISDCKFSHNGRGISLDRSNCIIMINNIFSNKSGIIGQDTHNNTIENNIFDNNHVGILLYRSNYNLITNNDINKNSIGIDLMDNSNSNIISNNTISYQKWYGIEIGPYCSDNIVYHNRFLTNKYNAWDKDSNIWDNGYPSGGNFWDDYNGTDADGDGIGDKPYSIIGNRSEDRYPLGNFKPTTPEIEGKRKFKVGEEGKYPYTIYSIDPEDGNLMYFIDWGDGTYNEWNGPYPSGEKFTKIVTIFPLVKGTYLLFKVKAKDIYGSESKWGILEITVPRARTIFYTLIYKFLIRFPIIERLLNL
jgi:parallel beta-helix repeat protein